MAETMEERAEAALRAVGLTPERTGEEGWALAIREQVARVEGEGRAVAPLRRLSLPDRSESSSTDESAVVPPREFACSTCEDAGAVLTATRIVDGRTIRANPVLCPDCVPLEYRAARAGIDDRYHAARLDTLIEREGNAAAVTFARAWRGDTSVVLTSRGRRGDDLFGTGKTHIACAMLIGQIALGRPARFVSVQDYMEGMKARFDSAEPGDSASAYADRIIAEPLLCLDDLGQQQLTDWSRTQMHRLIDGRYRAQRPTILTTNLTPEQMAANLAGGSLDRLREYHWIGVGGTSLRGTK